MKNIYLTQEEMNFLKNAKSPEKMKKSDLSKEIIKGIALGGVIASMFVLPGTAIAYKWVDDLHKNHKRRLRDNLKRLLDRGYIKEDEVDKYVITPKGVLKLNEYKIEDLNIPKQKKWDNIWRIISFDIPEEKVVARKSLNKKIKDLGFIMLQKSVFVYPHPCKKEFEQIGEFFNVKDNIIFIEAASISNEKLLKQIFKDNNILEY
ncbi:CRISPR-associated endonuclease Cas2 [Patescibacteria group bacterium]|nr:CRISPR-associated endonuclease Cas2 [Patescibacteria group bacterium]MCG2694965.1 CRISPR-associated endonuclease Cas2 [Candidatus Parcubacteria bacterium]